jgi:hypothetical protein
MDHIKILCLTFFLSAFYLSGNCQKIVAFNKSGKVKRIKYYEGELIKLKTSDKLKVTGIIDKIKDSSFTVNGIEVSLKEVTRVYNTQKLYGFNLLHRATFTAGIAYLPLSTTNRLINNDSPIVSSSALVVSGSFLSVALVTHFIYNISYKISDKRPLMIIDLTI